jgi:MerR family transcriptional regulator, light-induced transcriptional regulator
VVAGSPLDDDTVARWAYAIRLAAGAMPVAVFRRGSERVRVRATGTRNLPSAPRAAQRRILELIELEGAPAIITPGRASSLPRSASM